jgi:hypothetical protein
LTHYPKSIQRRIELWVCRDTFHQDNEPTIGPFVPSCIGEIFHPFGGDWIVALFVGVVRPLSATVPAPRTPLATSNGTVDRRHPTLPFISAFVQHPQRVVIAPGKARSPTGAGPRQLPAIRHKLNKLLVLASSQSFAPARPPRKIHFSVVSDPRPRFFHPHITANTGQPL